MLTFSGGYGEDYHPIGQRAIIFVAHSMGGLVVKKAYSLGKHDRDYTSMISSVYGMVFLATPHRGTQYAKMLNHILSAAPLGAPPKAYLSDLDIQSTALQDINEQFRTTCENISLVSFFETLKTSLGVTKIHVRDILDLLVLGPLTVKDRREGSWGSRIPSRDVMSAECRPSQCLQIQKS